MKFRAALLSLALLAGPAAAQPTDVIGKILEQQVDENAVEEGRQQAAPPEAEPNVPDLPTGPAPKLTAPVHIDETGKNPDGPLSTRAMAYDSRIRASFASAQGFQGPLDGSWTLSDASGGELYAFELVDKGRNVVEGAWRDLRRKGALGGSGFVDRIERVGSEMSLSFADGASLTLEPTTDGRWSGQLTDAAGARNVVLRRAAP